MAASAGFDTDADWLDVHFEAERPEYTAMLDSVGIQPGWTVSSGLWRRQLPPAHRPGGRLRRAGDCVRPRPG